MSYSRFLSRTLWRKLGTHGPTHSANLQRNSKSRKKLYVYVTAGVLGTSLSAYYYLTNDSSEPLLIFGGLKRFARTLACGARISLAYYWFDLTSSPGRTNRNARNDEATNSDARNADVVENVVYEDVNEEYREKLAKLHERCAELMVQTCLLNGGLYIKIGQGVGSLNHILPPEYITALARLQQECLTRSEKELDEIFRQDFPKDPLANDINSNSKIDTSNSSDLNNTENSNNDNKNISQDSNNNIDKSDNKTNESINNNARFSNTVIFSKSNITEDINRNGERLESNTYKSENTETNQQNSTKENNTENNHLRQEPKENSEHKENYLKQENNSNYEQQRQEPTNNTTNNKQKENTEDYLRQEPSIKENEQQMSPLLLEDNLAEKYTGSPEAIFAQFDRRPVAAASLAQVYKAVTKDGRTVAVKVQYIDLQRRFHSDLLTIRVIMNLVGWIHPKFKLSWILDDIEATLAQELDFENEARNAEKCARQLGNLGYVYVPKVLWEYTTKRILTTEFIDGIKISDKEALLKNGFSLKDIDQKLISAFSEQIFNTGFVHADPHPGNVLVRSNSKNGRAELVLLDHGLYETVPHRVREALCDFWRALVLGDRKEMERYARVLQVNDYEIFAEILTQRPLHSMSPDSGLAGFRTSLSEADVRYMQEMARERFDKITRTLREMPHNLIFVIRNLNTVRSIAREHGDPVDRLRVMVRTALRNKHGFISLLRFEFIMWKAHLRIMILRLYLRFLSFIGRAPDTTMLLRQIS